MLISLNYLYIYIHITSLLSLQIYFMDAYTFTRHFSVAWGNFLHAGTYGLETTDIDM